jgi:hypothetical protein
MKTEPVAVATDTSAAAEQQEEDTFQEAAAAAESLKLRLELVQVLRWFSKPDHGLYGLCHGGQITANWIFDKGGI